jgi:hypothetical protein
LGAGFANSETKQPSLAQVEGLVWPQTEEEGQKQEEKQEKGSVSWEGVSYLQWRDCEQEWVLELRRPFLLVKPKEKNSMQEEKEKGKAKSRDFL